MKSTILSLILALLGAGGLAAAPIIRRKFGRDAERITTTISAITTIVGAYEFLKEIAKDIRTSRYGRSLAMLSAAALLFWTLDTLFPVVNEFFERHPYLGAETAFLLALGVFFSGEYRPLRWFGRIFVFLILPALWIQELVSDREVQVLTGELTHGLGWHPEVTVSKLLWRGTTETAIQPASTASAPGRDAATRASPNITASESWQARTGSSVDICGERIERYQPDRASNVGLSSGFRGAWTGKWNRDRVCAWLLVRSVGGDGRADIQYGYVPSSGTATIQSGRVQIEQTRLTFTDKDGSDFAFVLDSTSGYPQLRAQFTDSKQRTFNADFVKLF